MVCVLPALTALGERENEKIIIAARGEAFELCQTFPIVEHAVSLEERTFSQLFLNYHQIEKEVRKFFLSFSNIVSWYGNSQRTVLENLLLLSHGQLRSFLFFTGQEECHAVSYYLYCVGEETLRCPSLRLPQGVQQWVDSFWRQHWESSSQVLALHPGSGGRKKRWDSEGFRKIARWWRQKKRNGRVLILLGPAERKEREEWRMIGKVVSDLSVVQTAALLSRAVLYLGNDSGVSHLAGAVGVCGIVLFGPTPPRKWRPLGGNLSVIQNTAYRAAFPSREGISLEEITVDEVVARLGLLGE